MPSAKNGSTHRASLLDTVEGRRIYDARHASRWRHWGPYLSERQWGTVREDYSAQGDAWHYLPHEHARSCAYRWGEDGIGGFGDLHVRWCPAVALWNDLPGDCSVPLRVRSMVGLIPLFAVHVLSSDIFKEMPAFTARQRWFLNYHPDLASLVSRWVASTEDEQHLLSLLRGHRMKRLLCRALDPGEFLSDYGIRSLSRAHAAEPYVFEHDGARFTVEYVPGESTSRLFGGNSNWRGPIWMPVNYLLLESLYEFHQYYTDDFRVECPTGSGTLLSLREIADELSCRVCGIFLRDASGRRPVFGDAPLLQERSEFRDHILFHEYFDGDAGSGLGASHQTGWTGLVALLLHPRSREDARNLETGKANMHDFGAQLEFAIPASRVRAHVPKGPPD